MPNRLFSEDDLGLGKPNPPRPATGAPKGTTPEVKTKPAFPVTTPGKAQPRSRSAGVSRARIYPNSKGI